MSQLAPPPKFAATYVNAGGFIVPAVGYKLYTYAAGTTTPKDSYTNYALSATNTNPIILNARGECELWLSGNYKLVLKTDADVTVWTVDEVRDLSSNQTLSGMTLAGTLTVTSTAVTWSGNPTHSGNHTWSGNQVFNGNVTIGDAAADTMTVTPNAVTWTNNPTHSGAHTWSGVQTFSANPAGRIVSTTYTPVSSAKTNIATDTWYTARYSRIGDVVSVSGVATIDPTSATTYTFGTLTIPVSSAFASATQLSGSMTRTNASGGAGLTGTFLSNVGAGTASFSFLNDADTAARDWCFAFSYVVV